MIIPTITLIIPAYNASNTILNILGDLAQVSHFIHEIIIVDDESKDDTLEVVKKWQETHHNVRIISISNSKAGGARNEGLALASGEWCWFVDADDRIEIGYIEQLIKTLTSSIDIVVFNGYWVSLDYKRYLVKNPPNQTQWLGHDFISQGLKLTFFNVGPWNKLYKTSFLKEHNLSFTPHRFHEDYDFNVRVMLENPRITFINLPIYQLVKTKNSITTNTNLSHIEKLIEDSYYFVQCIESIVMQKTFPKNVMYWVLNDCAERRLKLRYQSKKYHFKPQDDKQLILKYAKTFKTKLKAVQALYLANILMPILNIKRTIQKRIEKK
jgi:glycosyltransferase involved in cell wall biosynthesis